MCYHNFGITKRQNKNKVEKELASTTLIANQNFNWALLVTANQVINAIIR